MPDQRVLVASLVVISILYLFLIYEVEAFCSPCLDCEACFTITSSVLRRGQPLCLPLGPSGLGKCKDWLAGVGLSAATTLVHGDVK